MRHRPALNAGDRLDPIKVWSIIVGVTGVAVTPPGALKAPTALIRLRIGSKLGGNCIYIFKILKIGDTIKVRASSRSPPGQGFIKTTPLSVRLRGICRDYTGNLLSKYWQRGVEFLELCFNSLKSVKKHGPYFQKPQTLKKC